jgi:hypothetical protein
MNTGFTFRHVGLIVTGEGEEQFLPRFLRALLIDGDCTFEVVRRIGQRSEVRSPARRLRMVGSGKVIPTIDEEQIGLPARRFLTEPRHEHALLVVVDDVERSRGASWLEVFRRYRVAPDTMLPAPMRARAAVHFLKNMLEAYYFADAAAISSVLGLSLVDHDGDVEQIGHPKNRLKQLFPNFDEVEHGHRIVDALDLEKVLCNPETCPTLRALVGWVVVRLGHQINSRFQLDQGIYSTVTGHQIR